MTLPEIEFASTSDVELVQWMGGDDMVALAAWVSFNRDDEDRLHDQDRVEKLINFLWSNHHTSPFEHTVFTFAVETPIFVVREFMRHRSASYNEMSGRYTVMPHKYYVPCDTRPKQQVGKAGDYKFEPGTYMQNRMVDGEFRRVYAEIVASYEKMLAAGIAKEVARDILPVGTYSRFYVTMNARNLMHFLRLRTSEHALYEIRELAAQMEKIFAEKMPYTHAVYRKELDKQQNPVVTKPYTITGISPNWPTINVNNTVSPDINTPKLVRVNDDGSTEVVTPPGQEAIDKMVAEVLAEQKMTGRNPDETYESFTHIPDSTAYKEGQNVLRDRVTAYLKRGLEDE